DRLEAVRGAPSSIVKRDSLQSIVALRSVLGMSPGTDLKTRSRSYKVAFAYLESAKCCKCCEITSLIRSPLGVGCVVGCVADIRLLVRCRCFGSPLVKRLRWLYHCQRMGLTRCRLVV